MGQALLGLSAGAGHQQHGSAAAGSLSQTNGESAGLRPCGGGELDF